MFTLSTTIHRCGHDEPVEVHYTVTGETVEIHEVRDEFGPITPTALQLINIENEICETP